MGFVTIQHRRNTGARLNVDVVDPLLVQHEIPVIESVVKLKDMRENIPFTKSALFIYVTLYTF
jgi:hypothetical protein